MNPTGYDYETPKRTKRIAQSQPMSTEEFRRLLLTPAEPDHDLAIFLLRWGSALMLLGALALIYVRYF